MMEAKLKDTLITHQISLRYILYIIVPNIRLTDIKLV